MVMDYQLSDIEAFCTSCSHYGVLGVDPTFDLGPFNVTVATYKQFQLVKPNGQAPTFIGPLFIHYRKTFACYNSFISAILGLIRIFKNILAFGTDGEEALANSAIVPHTLRASLIVGVILSVSFRNFLCLPILFLNICLRYLGDNVELLMLGVW